MSSMARCNERLTAASMDDSTASCTAASMEEDNWAFQSMDLMGKVVEMGVLSSSNLEIVGEILWILRGGIDWL